jgi:hypothetical protein
MRHAGKCYSQLYVTAAVITRQMQASGTVLCNCLGYCTAHAAGIGVRDCRGSCMAVTAVLYGTCCCHIYFTLRRKTVEQDNAILAHISRN